MDYYEVLQVHPKADEEVIAKAYRALIAKHHPDHGGDEERCKLINEAYAVLKDRSRREAYDREHRRRGAASQSSGHHEAGERRDSDFARERVARAARLDAFNALLDETRESILGVLSNALRRSASDGGVALGAVRGELERLLKSNWWPAYRAVWEGESSPPEQALLTRDDLWLASGAEEAATRAEIQARQMQARVRVTQEANAAARAEEHRREEAAERERDLRESTQRRARYARVLGDRVSEAALTKLAAREAATKAWRGVPVADRVSLLRWLNASGDAREISVARAIRQSLIVEDRYAHCADCGDATWRDEAGKCVEGCPAGSVVQYWNHERHEWRALRPGEWKPPISHSEGGIWVGVHESAPSIATVHHASCSHCSGLKATPELVQQADGGKWIGPFASLRDVVAHSARRGRAVHYCLECRDRLRRPSNNGQLVTAVVCVLLMLWVLGFVVSRF